MNKLKFVEDMTPAELAETMSDKFEPVVCDIKAEIAEAMKDPEYRKAHEENEEEFAMIRAMLEAQRNSRLSQDEIARRMGTKQPSISRMMKGKHSPCMKTLLAFIHANGMYIKHIELGRFEPPKKCNKNLDTRKNLLEKV